MVHDRAQASLLPCILVLLVTSRVVLAEGETVEMERRWADARKLATLGRLLEAGELVRGDLEVIAGMEDRPAIEMAGRWVDLLRRLGWPGLSRAGSRLLGRRGLETFNKASTLTGDLRHKAMALAEQALAQVADPTGEQLEARGLARAELDCDREAAAADLEASLARGGGAGARRELALLLWKNGVRERATGLASSALRELRDRRAAAVVVASLRSEAHTGDRAAVRGECRRWLEEGLQPRAASLFHRLSCELEVEDGQLERALAELPHVAPDDQAWLMGGIVRLARASARSPDSRRAVLAVLARTALPATTTSAAAALRLAGDLALEDGDPRTALRWYAASITSGDLEAVQLAARVREVLAHAGKEPSPGGLVDLLELGPSREAARPEGMALRYEQAALLASPWQARDDRDRAWRRFVAAPWIAGGLALGFPPSLPVSMPPGPPPPRVPGLPGPSSSVREQLLQSFARHDVQGTLRALDAVSLVSWQVAASQQDVTPRQPQGLAGAAARALAPLADAVVPPALALIRDARRFVEEDREPTAEERAKLERIAAMRAPEQFRVADPIAIDTDGSGRIELTSEDGAGVPFDLLDLGRMERIQWLAGRDAWLCEDGDGDGRITSGREMFGTAGGFSDGFEKLALRDRDGDGQVSGGELKGLCLWMAAGDGRPGELVSVRSAGLDSIGIPRVGLRSSAMVNGQQRLAAEVWPVTIGADDPGGPLTESLPGPGPAQEPPLALQRTSRGAGPFAGPVARSDFLLR